MLEQAGLIAFKNMAKDLYERTKQKASLAVKIHKLNLEDAYLKAHNVELVKTIWQIDKEVNLNEFYYPTTIEIFRKRVVLHNLDSFPENGKIVIQGTAGQGKSILMRYLTSTALKEAKTFPIFAELRKISEKKDLIRIIQESLSDLGIKVDNDELNSLLATGKCTLLLDAFDEIQEKFVTDVISTIESWCNSHYQLPIIISSRPNSEIQKVAYFKVFNICPLQVSDYEPLLNKFFPSTGTENTVVNSIIKAIHNSETQISQVVTTPLLLTLLVIIYKSYNQIPNNLSEFYSKLFEILCFRHDATKPGFSREFLTGLTESELEKLFDAFCFCCMKSQKNSLNRSDAITGIKEAISLTDLNSVNSDRFLRDITKVTCLMIEEGFEYHFIHKSIREFHAAHFIKEHGNLELKKAFYEHVISNPFQYMQELNFLSSIDTFNYNKFFFIPHTKSVIEAYQFDVETKEFKTDLLQLISSAELHITYTPRHKNTLDVNQKIIGTGIRPPRALVGDVIHDTFNDFYDLIFETMRQFNDQTEYLEIVLHGSDITAEQAKLILEQEGEFIISPIYLVRNLELEPQLRDLIKPKLIGTYHKLEQAENSVKSLESSFAAVKF